MNESLDLGASGAQDEIAGQTIRIPTGREITNRTVWFARGEVGRRIGYVWYADVKFDHNYGRRGVVVEEDNGAYWGAITLESPSALADYGITRGPLAPDELTIEDATRIFADDEHTTGVELPC